VVSRFVLSFLTMYGTLFFLAIVFGRFFNEVTNIFVLFPLLYFYFYFLRWEVIWKGGSVVSSGGCQGLPDNLKHGEV